MIFGFLSLNIISEYIFWPEYLNAQNYILVTIIFISWNNILKKIQCNYSLEFSGFWYVIWLLRPKIILGHVVPRCVAINLARCLYIDLIYILNSLYYIWNIIGFHTHNMWKRVVLLKNKSPPWIRSSSYPASVVLQTVPRRLWMQRSGRIVPSRGPNGPVLKITGQAVGRRILCWDFCILLDVCCLDIVKDIFLNYF